MSTEEGVEGTGLVPAGEEIFLGVAEETTYVCAGEGEPGDSIVEDHWESCCEMLPVGLVVASPHCASALGTCEVRAS